MLTLFTLTLLLIIGSTTLYVFRVRVLDSSLSRTFAVPVRVSSFNFSQKNIAVENLEIYNIPKSAVDKAMSIGSVEIKTPLHRFLQVNTIIDEITLNNVEVNVEFYDEKQTDMNWDYILAASSIASSSPVDSDAAVVLIRTLKITNLTVTVRTPNEKPKVYHIPQTVTYKNLNSRRGIPTTVIADMIVRITLMEVFSIGGLARLAGTLFDTALSPFEKILELPFGK